ncbi:uncharacterized protein LOC113467066 [Diaphorina citri]|uniref:Uncharacterized protein LOC113467066 n=1 Tax=Diaphorina citri TaxID=121845 RepID=A0A3Q0IVY4_DIACI|nr:uncharacterized protein LOC113467066 [Diaphorina citri]
MPERGGVKTTIFIESPRTVEIKHSEELFDVILMLSSYLKFVPYARKKRQFFEDCKELLVHVGAEIPAQLESSSLKVVHVGEFKIFRSVELAASHPTGGPKVIALDHSGFLDIVDTVYDLMDEDTRRTVPISAFIHYCNVLLYQRYANVHASAYGHHQEAMSLNAIVGSDPTIPKPIAAYLNAIGEFIDPNGRRWVPDKLPARTVVAHVPGSFGRVGPNTHYAYGSVPSPAITLLTLLADIAHTTQDLPVQWNLPVGFRPAVAAHAALPTSSMLGYRTATNIGNDIAEMYTQFGLHVDWANVDAPIIITPSTAGIPVTRVFMDYVSNALSQTSIPNAPINITPTGSQSILLFGI